MSYYCTFMTFIIISILLDLFLLKHIKRKDPVANVLFGLQITLMGMFVYFIVYNTTFYTPYGSLFPYFIAIYLITTGVMFSFLEFIKQ